MILVAGDARTVVPTPDAPGLAELMSGEASFAEAIHRDAQSRLHVIPAGRDCEAGTELASVLDALKGTYDVVVLGAPRAMGVEEAQSVTERTEIAVLGPGEGAETGALLDA